MLLSARPIICITFLAHTILAQPASDIKVSSTRAGRLEQKLAEVYERLNSVKETSKTFGVSTFTTRRLIKAKQLRAVRVGKRVLIPQSEIDRVIAEGCGKSAF